MSRLFGTDGVRGLANSDLTPELARHLGHKVESGLLISQVKEGSPAEAVGLRPGLLITRVIKDRKSTAVGNVQEFRELARDASEMALYVETPEGVGHYLAIKKEKKD